MRSLVILVILVIVGLFLVSCGGSKPTPSPAPVPAPSPPSPTTAIDAKVLYSTNCAVCHGPNRQGVSNLGPALTPASLARLNDDEIRNAILKGRPNTAMTGFEGRLSAKEIDALIQLIKYISP